MRLGSWTAVVFAGFVGTVSAHETWVLPSAFSAKVGQQVRFDLTSGMDFPEPENAIKTDRVSKAVYRLGKGETRVAGIEEGDKSLVLKETFPREGLATLWLELHPREIVLTEEQVQEYLDEIGATKENRAAWARQKGKIPWKEHYTKHAKTFVAVGDAREDRSWRVGVGTGLEIVPDTDPTALRAGGDFTIRMLRNGKPVSGVPVGLLIRGTGNRVFKTTDAKGSVTFAIGKAGEAMLFAVHLRPTQDGKAWKSDFTNLTVLVH